MGTKATQDTVFTVFGRTQGLLADASRACTTAIAQIDAASMHFGELNSSLMPKLRGVLNNTDNPTTDWGAGFIVNINAEALAQLNVTDYDVDVVASRTAIQTVLTAASALFPRNVSDKVIHEEITPQGSTYDTPGDLTGLRADLVLAVDALE